jgi:hypothetical protein
MFDGRVRTVRDVPRLAVVRVAMEVIDDIRLPGRALNATACGSRGH